MSLIRVNDQLISVQDLMTWISSLISLHDSGRLKKFHLPDDISSILSSGDDRPTRAEKLYSFIIENETFLETIQNTVRNNVSQDLLKDI